MIEPRDHAPIGCTIARHENARSPRRRHAHHNSAADFGRLLTTPSEALPIIVGEHGPSEYSNNSDIRALWDTCQDLELTHTAWSFHHRCPPNLLQDSASDGCGLSASTGYDFPRTDWGNMLHDYLATPW